MQRIERYGVVAMVFLIVTIAAIVFWGEGEPAAADGPRPTSVAKTSRPTPPRRSVASTLERPRKARARAPLAGSERPASGARPQAELKPIPVARGAAVPPTRVEPLTAGPGAGERGRRRSDRGSAPAASGPASIGPGKPARQRGRAPAASPVLPSTEGPAVAARSGSGDGGGEAPVESAVYVVRAGDTLSEISQAVLGSARRWRELIELNPGVRPAGLRVGTRLRLPAGVSSAPAVAAGAAPALVGHTRVEPLLGVPASDRTHVVAPGEVLSVIAQRELGSAGRWREIVDLNPGLDPDRLAVGTVLALPAGASAPAGRGLIATASVNPTASRSPRVR